MPSSHRLERYCGIARVVDVVVLRLELLFAPLVVGESSHCMSDLFDTFGNFGDVAELEGLQLQPSDDGMADVHSCRSTGTLDLSFETLQ